MEPEQLGKVFTDERLKKLGLLLEFLRADKQQKLISSLEDKYPDIPINEVDGKKALYLEQLDSCQLFDLLKLAKGMKSNDFDTAQLVNVEVDPQLEGYHPKPAQRDEEVESSFEI